jgi:hypothetical protein
MSQNVTTLGGALIVCAVLLFTPAAIPAWSQSASASNLAVEAASLPNAAPHHPYRFEFRTLNGIPPLKWTVIDGDVPAGLQLSEDGVLAGRPIAAGQFRFLVQVTDSSRPPQTAKRSVDLRVVPPLLLEWKNYAKVSGNRIDGTVVVSNGTEDDFDFTIVVLAVADNGRATAIGYQHFPLKTGATSFEIPFGETLPRGAYVVHVDAIAEVPPKDAIYRARLQTRDPLQVAVGP